MRVSNICSNDRNGEATICPADVRLSQLIFFPDNFELRVPVKKYTNSFMSTQMTAHKIRRQESGIRSLDYHLLDQKSFYAIIRHEFAKSITDLINTFLRTW